VSRQRACAALRLVGVRRRAVYATAVGPAYFRSPITPRRLFESAKVYEIDIGYSEDAINAACLELIRANQMSSAYVRPIVFRGAGGLGVLAKPGSPVDVAIMALDWGAYLGDALEHGADVCVSSWNRPAPNTFPSWVKAGGNYLNSQLIGWKRSAAVTPKASRSARMALNRNEELRRWAENWLKEKERAKNPALSDEEFEKHWLYVRPETMHEGAVDAVAAFYRESGQTLPD
jgi:Branched-chain amino acid aminotransferase/4-amino-4-deoxychorismate lyase